MPPHTAVSWLTRPRLYAYGIVSTLLAVATVYVAFTERSNFYAAVVFLGRSNGCLLILLNFLLVIALIIGRCLQLIFFGALRRSEVELVCERSWYSLVGTLLAVSIFRDDFSVSFVILFGVLLFLKVFHWLSAERVTSIMQSPSVPRVFHARMVSILFTLFLADAVLVGFSAHLLLVKKIKVGMMVLFTSEFIILTALLFNTIAQYVLNCIDMAREEPWEAKSLYVLYVDLAHDVVRLVTHGYFFILLTRLYGIPLSLIHDLYSAGRACATKVSALVRYRAAVKKMETKYPNASVADLENTDGTCIICREDMVALGADHGVEGEGTQAAPTPVIVTNTTPKKLPCGHIFHFRCLRSWIERQQSCPTCRRAILDDEPPAPAAAQQQQPQQHNAHAGAPPNPVNAAAQNGASPAAPAGPSVPSSAAPGAAHTPAAAEQQYDTRLQGFLSRLQSDLRKVREEGNLSARNASSSSRRRSTRSGQSTPRTAAAQTSALFGAGPSVARHQALFSRSHGGFMPQGGIFASQSGTNGPPSDGTSVGGLWLPPPPSTLYANGRRPVLAHRTESRQQGEATTPTQDSAADTGSKGKGKALAVEPVEVDESEDPEDPREAIRQATLRRFNQLPTAVPSSSSSAAVTAAQPSPPIGMIPLFDPSKIPDFSSSHLSSLPHPLLSESSAPTFTSSVAAGDLDAVLADKKRGVKEQIELLSGIQARIDGVIRDLTRVLDVVAPTPAETGDAETSP